MSRPVPDAHRALAHPLRARILATIADRRMSPVELAKELGTGLGITSYHVRVLADAGFLEPAGISTRRGAVQHHYRARTNGNMTFHLELTPGQLEAVADRLRALVEDVRAEASPDGDAVEVTLALLQPERGRGI